MITRICATLILSLALGQATADESGATARYLANEGVMVSHEALKVVFDPLFRYPHDYYQSVPKDMEAALIAGEPPFDGLDAVFISHYHADHFSPGLVLHLLREQEELMLFAPSQAVDGIREMADEEDAPVFDRIHAIDLAYRDEPVTLEENGILIEAVRIPHSGWPEGRLDVQNIAFRVTLNGVATVLHMGDADGRDDHFAHDAGYWESRHTDMAFPPYWFFLDSKGRHVLDTRLKPGHAVGVHIPADPAERPPALTDYDVFTEPGEIRDFEP